jgi:predicted glycosyltransferase
MKAEHTLIAPLHWGLGHAARCIPIINNELQAGNVVFVAATGGQKALITARFPEIIFVDIPFMEITYPRDGNMVWHFTKKGPELLHSIWREHRVLKKLIEEKNITKVISDSRFGLWNKKVKSVFITHQIEIQTPIFQSVVNAMNRWVMSKYDEVWIPDYEQKPGLAGSLSHPKNLAKHAKYIGPLSRFRKPDLRTVDLAWDAVALISGPEPQRTLYEAEITRQFIESGKKCLILKGKPHQPEHKSIDNITVLNHMNDEDLVNALLSANQIYARSGYSTIMDLHVLGLKANYVPTPGQTEQEYLAKLQNK